MFSWAEVGGSRAAVMGVLNVTPDSFSDGGRWLDADAAVAHGLALVAAGADLLDVGGESTRPGAAPVDAAEERRRIEPVIARLAAESGVPVSVDTTKASVAAAALDAGARIVNDVSAGRTDPDLFALVAERGAGLVAMHMLGDPRTMQDDPRYDDVVREVGDFLVERADAARAAGIADVALAVDPGIGFGKTTAHNLDLLAHLDVLIARVGLPLVVGTSRKRFIGRVLTDLGGETGEPPAERRDDGTLATTVWAAELGARVIRVHDAKAASRAIDLLELIVTVEAA
ncbi:MAG: dihydropteroate synthase [Acidimicrobiia bacterium]|jgi:dihydropteroate synthase